MNKIPCGRTLGHGESCCEGHLCDGCQRIAELEAENQALKEAIEWALLRQANVADYAVSDDSDTYYIRWLDEPTKLKRPPNPPFHEALIKAMLAERGKG